jgi:hypothetical protein
MDSNKSVANGHYRAKKKRDSSKSPVRGSRRQDATRESGYVRPAVALRRQDYDAPGAYNVQRACVASLNACNRREPVLQNVCGPARNSSRKPIESCLPDEKSQDQNLSAIYEQQRKPRKDGGSWSAVLACSRLFTARGTAKGPQQPPKGTAKGP